MHPASMIEAWQRLRAPHERLRWARQTAGYDDASEAARAMSVEPPTYLGHENGSRGLSRAGKRYADFYRISFDWLLTGRGSPKPRGQGSPQTVASVPVAGFVGAGAETHYVAAGELDRVLAPEGSTADTVAVEIRGESLGSFFDRWIIFYDDVRRPVTSDLIGKLCVVGLEDGRVLVKLIKRSRTRGLFHLISQTEAPILDVKIEWAARVKSMTPR